MTYNTIANLITIVTLLWLWFDNMRLREKLNAVILRSDEETWEVNCDC